MQSKATTVRQYLEELPNDRRAAIETVRKAILRSLQPGYEEGMQYGMIGYYVPHSLYPPGYHCDPKQPLPFVCLASQKNHMAVYMSCTYISPEHERWFREAWAKTGRKLDMGKSCIRVRKLEDLALEVIGESIRKVPVADLIKFYESAIKPPAGRAAARRAARSSGPPKKPARAVRQPTAPKKRRG